MERTMERAGRTAVLVLGGGRGSRLDPLTRLRSKPAVPIAGKYRLIDIAISNAINSGLRRLFVLTQFNSQSLHTHIGATYRFDAFSGGYVQILAAQQTPAGSHWFQGTADAVRQNLHLIKEMDVDRVLILSGDHLYRMDYRDMIDEQVESGADLSVAVQPCSAEAIGAFGAARVDREGRIVEFREKPTTAEAQRGMEVDPSLLEAKGIVSDRPYIASMGIYLFRKQVLLDLLDNDLADFGQHIVPLALDGHRVRAHFFTGYWRDIGTIRAFFDAHADLVSDDPPFSFHDPGWPFFTHPRYLPGAKLWDCRVDRAVVAEGSVARNCQIERSVIGVRSVIFGAQMRRSLIMGADYYDRSDRLPVPVGIGEGSVIEDAIIDKNARIGRNVHIGAKGSPAGTEGQDWAIRDGIVVVGKNALIPDGTVI